MKIVATGFGAPSEVLQQVASEARAPEVGEIAIDVRAAGVNPKDVKLYANADYSRVRGQAPHFPLDLGLEASGVVTGVGRDAIGPAGPIAIGDEVIAFRVSGAYAYRIVVEASKVMPKPTRLSWEQAGSMMLVATTATHALAAVRARPGQTILVHGAAGSVGSYVVQLAALAGIRVIGSASNKNFDQLRRFGVRPVRYGDGLEQRIRKAAPSGVDAAIDLVGTDEATDVSMALVRDLSRIATVVNFARAKLEGFLALGGEAGQDPSGLLIRDNARLVMCALAQTNALNVTVPRSFPLARAADAHQSLLEGGAGRLVIVP